jgi:hypothetical protein
LHNEVVIEELNMTGSRMNKTKRRMSTIENREQLAVTDDLMPGKRCMRNNELESARRHQQWPVVDPVALVMQDESVNTNTKVENCSKMPLFSCGPMDQVAALQEDVRPLLS